MRPLSAEAELELAHSYLADQPDGTKLSRKRAVGALAVSHSYVKIDGEVYKIVRQTLGQGAYSRVKLLEKNGQFFAMKVSNGPNQRPNPHLKKEIEIEQEFGFLLGQLKRVDSEKHLRILPYLGKSLWNYRHQLSEEQAISIILQAVQEVMDLHSGKKSSQGKAYLHRDIKPDNLMVDEQGVVKLVDFGFLVEKPERIMHDALYGTPGYIAPESRRGQFSVATDIYALGVTIYDLVPDSMHSVLRIARLMWADNPDLRPSLELVKLALLVRKSMGVSHERLAQILVENDAETQNPEDAIVAGVVLANATIENGFSDRDNFDLLVANSMLREIILGVVSAPDLQQFIFQILKNSKVDHFLNPHSVLQKSFAKLKADNQASPHNLYRLMKYSSFRKWLSADHFLVDQLSELFCELVYQNDLDFLRSLLLDENSLALRLRAQNGFMDALSTALDSAISQRKLAIAVELILFGAESEDQSTVIFLLAAAGELNLLKRLLSHDRDQLNSQNVSGDTPLMLAASHGHDAVIEYFITQAVDLNVRNNCQNKPKSLGNTALFYAIDQGKWSSAKLLLKAGADPKLNGAFNCSPLLRCLQQNQFEMAAYCLFYGANLDLQTRKLMVQHKADLVAAINDMLKSELCSDVAGAELGLAFLRRLGVIKNPDSDDQLFPALFGGCCIGLFKPASLRLLEKLAENLSKPRAGIMELVA